MDPDMFLTINFGEDLIIEEIDDISPIEHTTEWEIAFYERIEIEHKMCFHRD